MLEHSSDQLTTANSKEHYVTVIQGMHRHLRKRLAECKDFKQVWEIHCSDHANLQNYALAMEQLATDVWADHCDGQDRTTWCRELIIKYFHAGKMQELLLKDKRRFLYFKKDPENFVQAAASSRFDNADNDDIHHEDSSYSVGDQEKIKLLDVGSCHNPFIDFLEFETVAIDISPANNSVYTCDFLTVDVDKESGKTWLGICDGSLSKLPANYFNVVVFSLLLSYLPCPHSRWLLCEKACNVLCTNGLLLIITPDSSHQNKHVKLMKQWKFSIESIGFQRIVYEKDKHMHLMAFRKIPNNFIWDKRKYNCSLDHVLYIPQDFSAD